jgi:BclA-like protein
MRSRLLVALVAGSAAFGVVSIVQASIPGPNGVINACYRKGSGELRVIDTGEACKSKEKPLTWSQATPEYAYIYDLSPPDLASTVAANAQVPFAHNGPMTAGITYLSNGQITIATAGVYRVEFIASVNEAGQLDLEQNNVAVPETVYGRATGTSQISGQVILDVAAGDILTLKNVSSTALTFTPNAGGTHPDVSASIVIERLG